MKLQKAGLGRRLISFHKYSTAISVKAKLEEVYPQLACSSDSTQISNLHQLFPDLPSVDIEKALKDCGGNIEAAASTLLDNTQGKLSEDEMPTYVADSSSDSESEIWNLPLATVIHLQPNSEEAKKTAIQDYRDATIVSESAVFRVYVNRMSSDFANDVLGIYKNQSRPAVFGISKVVIHYLVSDTDEIPLIEVADIPDIDLRIALNELNSLCKDEAPGIALKDFLTQYRDEASILDTSLSDTNRHVIGEQIMLPDVST
ncbi:PREDICTED: uncharacterized protein LOC107339727 [Paramuricea clavata]|uniref:PREDICTED: uncharacterized protein LOC107339727 n=1 Tax=Paramuricea clavata TaxID=317549 RepID=A0A7D9HBB4_PARCT|nr:PREDICTED: uncharacterized protein LOC107339727 [Paramuricea clavata]